MPASNFSLGPTVSMKHHAGPHFSFRNVALARARPVPQSRLLPRTCPLADLSDLSFFCWSNLLEETCIFQHYSDDILLDVYLSPDTTGELVFSRPKESTSTKLPPVAMHSCYPF